MGFCLLQKNIGKNLSNKYGQKLLNSAKKSAIDAIKTDSKKAIQKTAEATGDLIGNKIADKWQVFRKNLQQSCTQWNCKMMKQKYRHKDTYLQKKDNKLLTK